MFDYCVSKNTTSIQTIEKINKKVKIDKHQPGEEALIICWWCSCCCIKALRWFGEYANAEMLFDFNGEPILEKSKQRLTEFLKFDYDLQLKTILKKLTEINNNKKRNLIYKVKYKHWSIHSTKH